MARTKAEQSGSGATSTMLRDTQSPRTPYARPHMVSGLVNTQWIASKIRAYVARCLQTCGLAAVLASHMQQKNA